MKNINLILCGVLFASGVSLADETLIKTNLEKKDTKYFLYTHLGYAKIDTNHPYDDEGIVDMGIGYNYSDRYFATLGYQTNFENSTDTLRGVEQNTLYTSFNKRFDTKYNPYLGVILGYNDMTVYQETTNFSDIDEKSDTGWCYGVQGGISFPLYEKFTFGAKLQYLQIDLKANEIEVKNSFGIFGGVSYQF